LPNPKPNLNPDIFYENYMNVEKLWLLNNTIQCIMAANRVNENEFKVY
jgi:hypothetical protein